MSKSLKISVETKAELDKLKVHPRQSYDEIINILIEAFLKKGER